MVMGYARLAKMTIGGILAKLDFTPLPRNVGMVVADVALAMATKDALIRQGLIPSDIMKWWPL